MRRVRDITDPDIARLVAKSDKYLSSLYPPESNHAAPLETLVGEDSAFFAGYIEDQLAACGGVMLAEDDTTYGEIKRLSVDEKHRGKCLATKIMKYLEDYLVCHNVSVARLEAGPKQPEALGLYRKLGYTERGPFGTYKEDPLSVFLEKNLTEQV